MTKTKMTHYMVEITANTILVLIALVSLSGCMTIMHLNGAVLPVGCIMMIEVCAILQMIPGGLLIMGYLMDVIGFVQNSLRR